MRESIEKKEEIPDYDFDGLQDVASTTDMTGLIPRAIEKDEEIEAYEEMYHFLPPVAGEK